MTPSSGVFARYVPAREHKHCRMALERSGQNFRTLDPLIDAIVLDGGNRRLRNSGQFGQLALGQLLELLVNPPHILL